MPSFPENRALGRSFKATILWENKTNRNAAIEARVIKDVNQGRKKSIRSFYHTTTCCLISNWTIFQDLSSELLKEESEGNNFYQSQTMRSAPFG